MWPALSLLVVAASPAPLSTLAEQSGFTVTGRYEEVGRLCQAFAKQYPRQVKCTTFGTTPLGRPMYALIASADGTFTPEAVKKLQRPVVLFQGGIHAGEIDGKDAGFWLLRDVLEGKVAERALFKVTLIFVPVFNVDGHERFGKNQRPNQRGPEETGWRVTAQNYNLNRDAMKADAPETQAMLGLLHSYDPVLLADLHVTDGAQFQHDVSVTFEPQNVGPEPMRALGRALHVALFAELEQKGHLPVGFYPSFVKDEVPSSGFEAAWPSPRFATAYWSANHRFGVLVETHSWKDYATRVRTTFDVCAGLLRLAADDGARWLKAAKEADAATPALVGTDIPLQWDATAEAKPIDFLGYEYVIDTSTTTGVPWVRYDESKPQVWKVPLHDVLAPTLTLKAPRVGWLVPAPYAALVAAKLTLHGLQFKALPAERLRVPVQTFRGEPRFRPTSFEGHQLVDLKGEWKDDVQDLPAGSIFIPAAQPHLELAMHLLEPKAPDSLISWGFFNTSFEQKEYLERYLTEAFALEQLKDPAVKAAFDARMKDEAFAKDPEARLNFFFRRHPSYDARLNLVPIYRASIAP